MNALHRRLAFLLLAFGISFPAAASDLWIHVNVKESGHDPATVKINLPFSLIEAAAPLIEQERMHDPHIYWNGDRVEIDEVRVIWNQLKTGTGKVERNGSTFELTSAGSSRLLQIRTVERSKDSDGVITVPASIVEALLSGPGNELDVKAAIAALAKSGEGELLAADDDGTRVRMWVDRNPEPR